MYMEHKDAFTDTLFVFCFMSDGADQRNGSAVDAVQGDLTLVKQHEGLQLRRRGVQSSYLRGKISNMTERQMLERWKEEIKRSKYYISVCF